MPATGPAGADALQRHPSGEFECEASCQAGLLPPSTSSNYLPGPIHQSPSPSGHARDREASTHLRNLTSTRCNFFIDRLFLCMFAAAILKILASQKGGGVMIRVALLSPLATDHRARDRKSLRDETSAFQRLFAIIPLLRFGWMKMPVEAASCRLLAYQW